MGTVCINSLRQERLDVGLQTLCILYEKLLWLLSRESPCFSGPYAFVFPHSFSLELFMYKDPLSNLAMWLWTVAKDENIFSLGPVLPFHCISVVCWEIINLDFGKLWGFWWAMSVFAKVFQKGGKVCSKYMAERITNFDRWKSRRQIT